MVVILVLSILTNHQVSWNIKVHNNEKSVRSNEIVQLQADNYH